MDRSRLARIFALLLALVVLASCGAAGAGAADSLKALTPNLDDAVAKLKANDIAGAKASYQKFDDGWLKVEDAVRSKNKDGYKTIEDKMGDVKAALVLPSSPDPKKAIDAVEALDEAVDDVVATLK